MARRGPSGHLWRARVSGRCLIPHSFEPTGLSSTIRPSVCRSLPSIANGREGAVKARASARRDPFATTHWTGSPRPARTRHENKGAFVRVRRLLKRRPRLRVRRTTFPTRARFMDAGKGTAAEDLFRTRPSQRRASRLSHKRVKRGRVALRAWSQRERSSTRTQRVALLRQCWERATRLDSTRRQALPTYLYRTSPVLYRHRIFILSPSVLLSPRTSRARAPIPATRVARPAAPLRVRAAGCRRSRPCRRGAARP